MGRLKFTKGELKRQRDALAQYNRYLPTLQLKKQQLQIEILRQRALLEAKQQQESKKTASILHWAGLLGEAGFDLAPLVRPQETVVTQKNIAGINIPVFVKAAFALVEYDLFVTPLWVDAALDELQVLMSVRQEVSTLEKGVSILRQELRVTTQRVNLFEKVKIPDAEEAIRLIKIYIGDQMANAVGRSKMAKKKIQALALQEVAA